MNQLKTYITKRNNTLYMVTALRPKIFKVYRLDHQDSYIHYRDPVGFNNITNDFITTVFGDINLPVLKPTKCVLYGEKTETYKCTHFLDYDNNSERYTIFSRERGSVYIENLCVWFVFTMFKINTVLLSPQPIYFHGEIYESKSDFKSQVVS